MRRVRCNGCGRFCKWSVSDDCWTCDDCVREYHEPAPKWALCRDCGGTGVSINCQRCKQCAEEEAAQVAMREEEEKNSEHST